MSTLQVAPLSTMSHEGFHYVKLKDAVACGEAPVVAGDRLFAHKQKALE